MGPTNSSVPLNFLLFLIRGAILCTASYSAGLIKSFIPAFRIANVFLPLFFKYCIFETSIQISTMALPFQK